MLTNITVPLLGFVDTVVIGQLGDAKLIAALGLGSILITTLYGLFGFLRMGTTGLAAQAKVLRALEEDKIQRVGGNKDIAVDVRTLPFSVKFRKHAVSPCEQAAAKSTLSPT